jgi:hypothetical protein
MRFHDRNSEREPRGSMRQSNSPNAYRPSGRASDSAGYGGRRSADNLPADFRAVRDDPEVQAAYREDADGSKKRSFDDYQKQQAPSRGYDIEPAYAKRRSA